MHLYTYLFPRKITTVAISGIELYPTLIVRVPAEASIVIPYDVEREAARRENRRANRATLPSSTTNR